MRRNTLHCIVACCATYLLAMPLTAYAFESDVHFGLTQWLARQAGYTAEQAAAIALGDQRVDSGDVQFTDLLSLYACNAHDVGAADAVRAHHFPSTKGVPNPPEDRVVEAGGPAARKPLDDVLHAASGHETYLLYKLGEALHVLQDSWSNQGIPSVPSVSSTWFACDASLTWAEPTARGGWASHRSDLTALWPGDAMAMAAATYEALGRYPPDSGATRSAKPWAELAPQLDGFVRATTKTAKADWFVAHGITDVAFLDGINLPDGTRPFTAIWSGRHIPPLTAFASGQHGVDPGLLHFFDDFFGRWISSDDFQTVAAAFASSAAPRDHAATAGRSDPDAPIDRRQLAARLKLWRMRDHSSVADLAHQPQPLSARQLAAVDTAAAKPGALMHAASTELAVLPLLPNTPEAAPLLPYWVRRLAGTEGLAERAIATIKFRHAPYDAVEVLAVKTSQGWKVTAISATVEH
jgi:hypothetical protein